ncbi:hypothetical protein L6164_020794 [Bauhinia variegata]|uniref:Uncharacterized protein n=1 Tax=Bauhinia variegata TaxID=167791 RepID=A0ACB9MWJ2_BAUVA|nr:hypothetical protein L6164_020794 [Bauhinia variegata]
MDLTPSTTHTLDTDTQTPPPTHLTNTTNSLSFTNGSLKRHHHLAPPPSQPPHMVVSYKECLKNHAATIGGHALDGCGEFMPSPTSNPSDPRSLKCAACGCHRNFHRRDPQEFASPNFLNCFYSPAAAVPPPPLQPHRGLSPSTSPSMSTSPSPSPSPISSPSPPPVSHFPPSFHASAPHVLLALGTAYSGPSEEQHRNFNSTVMNTENPSGKKRHRTKFSHEQKEKMYLFSEQLGWKMQKGDDRLVQDFCNELGISRGVFKVWMHNNKHTFRKRSETGNAPLNEKINEEEDNDNGNGNGTGSGGFDGDINNPQNNTNSSNNDIHRNEGSSVNLHVSVNGSSS